MKKVVIDMYLNKFEQHLFKQQAYATYYIAYIYAAHSCAYIYFCAKKLTYAIIRPCKMG